MQTSLARRQRRRRNGNARGSGSGHAASGAAIALPLFLFGTLALLAIVGFAIKGLLWLGMIGIVLVLATIVIGAVRRAALSKKSGPKAPRP